MSTPKLPLITDAPNVRGAYVLVRAALNVPIEDGQIRNHFRLARAMPTIEWLIQAGARVILCGHQGREKENTLMPVYTYYKNCLQTTVRFSEAPAGAAAMNERDKLNDGEVLVLENLRRDPRETQNDADFARSLADLADVYVNDDFPTSHREHASLVGVPPFLPSYFGVNFVREYEELVHAKDPQHPSLFILGGAKFETKMPLVEQYLEIYDHILIGGALANDFYRARGHEIGRSLVSDIDLTGNPIVDHEKIILPKDVVVVDQAGQRRTTHIDSVKPDESIMDAGSNTIHTLELFCRNAKTILWNGPLGNYEAGFGEQTTACAEVVAASPAYTIVGGGDTIAAMEPLHNYDQYDFISTAGGAMLTFLEHGTLVAIDAVLEKDQ